MPNRLSYLLLINAAALLLMLLDKRNAIRRAPRVPERILFAAALLGGSLGGTLGMLLFHHKTRKPLFSVGFPVLLAVQTGTILLKTTTGGL